jgi:hypothetical protein
MKQIDWVKELEEKKAYVRRYADMLMMEDEAKKKKKKETVLKYDKNGWVKWYVTGTATSTNDVIYYTDTGTGNVF